ncbi:ACP S-malonyltransferase [Alkalibacter mobilis]|uniref:ACP S-malonyltransferase n=1 Tax=Alkalibacter mobilis TaxID=2787712 RepID=UPI00189D5B34|nr:ACP S-malonyltransferase [Alkalibacter mobilis]MBF7095934.1 ACP S-malonyltransferase [Alkalibacter mobilis]
MSENKIAMIFPGQGAQSPGMARELYENFDEAREIFERSEETLPFNVKELCFEGPSSILDNTVYAQPCLLTASMAALEVLRSKTELHPDFYAGLSLGEYTALTASGVFGFEEALNLVHNRGKFMESAVPQGLGTMAAIIGLDPATIEESCLAASGLGIVEVANYNYSGQTVIGGEVSAVEKAMEICLEKGAKRAVPLSVSGPFHTSMLKQASHDLTAFLQNFTLSAMNVPVISNYTAKPYESLAVVKEFLSMQVISPVRWQQSVVYMIESGVDTFIEIGPGKTLTNFIKRIDKKVRTLNVEDLKSLENTLKILEDK